MAASHDAPRVVVLVGLMGSGKSSVGRRLASALSTGFFDTDDLVATSAGRSVRDLFSEGEEVFRRHEREALLEALSACASGSGVIATGGGVVTRADNVADIERVATHVVWLDADVEELVARTSHGTHRPLLDGDARGKLIEMRNSRNNLYGAIATVRVETKGRAIPQIVDEIFAAVTAGAS
ncbi:MAG: shikimate kinase [Actinomycetota bacterium]